MQFDSLAFLTFFLIIAAVYWWVPAWNQRKNVLLAASYVFYAGWNPYFLPLLFSHFLIDNLKQPPPNLRQINNNIIH